MSRGLAGLLLIVALAASACSSSDTATDEGLALSPTESSTTVTVEPTSTSVDEPEAAPTTSASTSTVQDETDLEFGDALEAIVSETGVPGLGAAAFDSNGMIDIAVSGVRQRGDSTALTVEDRFHLGSNTKAMTAALFARLNEQGSGVAFDTTLAEAFTGATAIHDEYTGVTMAQLMTHTGGVPNEPDIDETILDLPATEGRALGTELVLSEPPEVAPGTVARYSNIGYVMVGAALEAATGQTWEDLMRGQVFEPLDMDSCGFGPPGVEGELDEPRGHDPSGRPVYADNPALIGPAGTVHCSMNDWGVFLVELLRGLRGESDFLTQASVEQLFEPATEPVEGIPGAQNVLGWIAFDDPQGTVYWHNGSNMFWYSQAAIVPEIDAAILVVTNEAGTGQQAADMAFEVLTKMFPE